jgi:hypothetical protein
MEATGRVIKRKCFTLEIKQSVHRCFKNIWEVNGPNLGKMVCPFLIKLNRLIDIFYRNKIILAILTVPLTEI